MAYEATAELAKRQRDLERKRIEAKYGTTIGDLATEYRQANRDLEAGYEGRGILRSGEAMRGRVRLGAAEKAAQIAAEQERMGALDQADLTYLQQLAELQAKGFKGGASEPEPEPEPEKDTTPTPGAPASGAPASGAPATQPGGGVGAPAQPSPPANQTPSCTITPQPGTPPTGYRYQWNATKCTWELQYIGAPTTVGGRPVTGGDTPTEVNPPAPNTVGGGAFGPLPPVSRPPTSGGVVVAPGDTPREVNPPPVNVLPAPGGFISGPDRPLANGGAVVDNTYIPPGINWAALGALASTPPRTVYVPRLSGL